MENQSTENEVGEWALTKHVFPKLLQQRNPTDTIRIWCPVCATGQEAIALIINLLEYMQAKRVDVPIQVFGTDTDETALRKARSGTYAADALHKLSPQQLKRFFVKNKEQYQVAGTLREMCIFANHDLLKDAPFPRLDLISFQNKEITLAAWPHQQILRSFYFGLKQNGFLLLHKPEALTDSKYFRVLPHTEQVYSRIEQPTGSKTYDFWQPNTEARSQPLKITPIGQKDTIDIDFTSEKLLLSRYVPASLVINSYYSILRFYGPVQAYLQPSVGKASLNVLNMLPEELAEGLKALITQVAKNQKIARRKDILLYLGEKETMVTLEVAYIQTVGIETQYLVVFKEKEEPAYQKKISNEGRNRPREESDSNAPDYSETLTKEYQQDREEWQASFEELTARYEESQQVNLALEQNKQELQAAIKELMVFNEDLEAQTINLSETSNLSINILEAIRDPLLLLHTNLNVYAANKAFYQAFRLTPADVEGRFMYAIGNSQWNVPEILAKLSEVVSKKNGYATFEVPTADNRVLLYNAVHIENGSKRNDRILVSMQDVTQYRQAREAKEWLAAVVESSNEGIISFTTNKTIISWNKGADEIFGYTDAEMVGKSITRLVRQRDKVGQHKLIERVMKGEVIRQLEMEHVHKDGRLIYVSTSIALIKDLKGNIKGMMASVQDITDRKEALEALRKSEERFRPIVSESSVGISRIDFNGTLLFVNPKFCDMLGFTAEELLGKTVWDITYANHIERTKRLLEKLHQEGTPFEYEKQLIRKNNTPLWVNVNLSAIKNQANVPFSVTAVIIDINQRKEAEDALHKTKESLQLAQEAANMGSWEIDLTTGKIVYHSLRNDQLMGYSGWQPEWDLVLARQYVIEEDKIVFDDAIDTMMSKGRLNMEVRVKWPDGSIHWIYKSGQVFYNDEGLPYRAAGIGMDITDRKLAEQRKEALLGIASHELKTPVTSIKAYAQILQERFVEAEDYNSAMLLTKMDRQVDKLTGLIKDLLDTTQITEGQLTLKQEIIDLNDLVEEVADDMQHGSQSHKIVKKLQPLPVVQADQERLRQVIINLIGNAIKYSPDANKVIVCSEYDGTQVIVHIQDYGMGIPQKMQQQVFERFFRVGSAKKNTTTGLGLGLFISSEIVRLHNGNIWVKSEEGVGSVFSFSLPITDVSAQ